MTADKLQGAWTLVSSIQLRNGVASKTYGDPPSGQIQYTHDGRVSAFLMNPCWKEKGENATKQTDLFLSYAGRWEIIKNEIHHFVEFCSSPRRIGATLVRNLHFINEDVIELTTAPETTSSGNVYETTLIWKRYS